MYQTKSHFCGPAAVQCAWRMFGARVGQDRLANILGTTEEGTDSPDLIQGLAESGCSWDELSTHRRADARAWLLRFGALAPMILCVDSWEHWVCVAGQCGDRLWLFDPTREDWNKHENGRWPLTVDRLLRRWRAARRLRKDGGQYYGIAILSGPSILTR